jgi:hypothetical protein
LRLGEAARRFAEANNRIDPEDPELVADYLRPTTEEGVFRQVLGWVENELTSRPPEEAKKILGPLKKEFQERFGQSACGSVLEGGGVVGTDEGSMETPVPGSLE